MCRIRPIAASCVLSALLLSHGAASLVKLLAAEPDTAAAAADDDTRPLEPIHKTDAEWRRQLTRRQFAVTRRGETEEAYSGKLWKNHQPGSYACICCDLELFRSHDKFDSQTGWPSFTAPVSRRHVAYARDLSDPEPRIEVSCARCEAHLGHVFGDGPPPTGHRYCINSAALKFSPRLSPPTRPENQTAKPDGQNAPTGRP